MDRLEALQAKSKQYDSVEPCGKCGFKRRYTRNRRCVNCWIEALQKKGSPRQAARAAGKKTYLSGKPCSNGHIAPRYTSTGSCSHCVNPPKATKSVRVPNVHPSDIPALLAYATALSLSRLS